MIGPSLEELAERFSAFTASYLHGPDEDVYNVQLKIDHSGRVLENAGMIAESENMDRETSYLAQVAALFHDTGRFPQYDRYKTFDDSKSENHARLGVRTLKKLNLLDGLSEQHRRIVLGAVILHNVKKLPPKPLPVLDTVTRVVRDSDKLDIIPVMLAHLDPKTPLNKVVALGVGRDPEKYSPAILKEIMARKNCDYRKMRWTNDFILLVASWLYDINFQASFKALSDRRYLDKIFAALPDNPEMNRLQERLQNDLNSLSSGLGLDCPRAKL